MLGKFKHKLVLVLVLDLTGSGTGAELRNIIGYAPVNLSLMRVSVKLLKCLPQ